MAPVDPQVSAVIQRIEVAAQDHDADEPDRLRRWRVLEPDAGRFLWFLVQATQARHVVEIGTSRGVSTLWLADAVRRTGGTLTSVDTDGEAQAEAHGHLVAAGVAEQVQFMIADGGAMLADVADGALDLLFLDAERTEYPGWWPHPVRVLRRSGVLVADNALSHSDEIAPLQELLESVEPDMGVTTLPIGKGELLGVRR